MILNFRSNGHIQTKEKINKRGPYIWVKWSCTNKRKKRQERTIYFSQMVMYKQRKQINGSKRKKKQKRAIYFDQIIVYK